ncbi:MAG: hypothetical protein M3071_01655 [Actinomycetota bacterium]|nr:hypothetical protein [Actinomycetota bacterium]
MSRSYPLGQVAVLLILERRATHDLHRLTVSLRWLARSANGATGLRVQAIAELAFWLTTLLVRRL